MVVTLSPNSLTLTETMSILLQLLLHYVKIEKKKDAIQELIQVPLAFQVSALPCELIPNSPAAC